MTGIDTVALNANLEIGHYDWRVIASVFDLSLTPFHERQKFYAKFGQDSD